MGVEHDARTHRAADAGNGAVGGAGQIVADDEEFRRLPLRGRSHGSSRL
jgi:hypothetical protein